jgi:hypothetical protein
MREREREREREERASKHVCCPLDEQKQKESRSGSPLYRRKRFSSTLKGLLRNKGLIKTSYITFLVEGM